ncbi:MAG: YdcF family protein [Flavobacteriales bacterium]|nr:YdcF family protein [Flavobacteriales bacterium]
MPRSTFAKALLTLGVLVLLCGTLWWMRFSILRAAGNYLMPEDPLQQVDAVYVLGGSSLDRGREAARVMHGGWSPMVYFTGGNIPTALESIGVMRTEAEVCLQAAIQAGLPPEQGHALRVGTSTMEESQFIRVHAKGQGYKRILVISSRFHLRRIGRVFREPFAQEGITVLLHGAPSDQFDEARWWQYEEGLIMLNNEYAKLLYYAWRY